MKELQSDVKILKSSETSLKNAHERTVKDFETKIKELIGKGIQDTMHRTQEKAKFDAVQAKSDELEQALKEKDNHLSELKQNQSAGSQETEKLKSSLQELKSTLESEAAEKKKIEGEKASASQALQKLESELSDTKSKLESQVKDQ